MNFSNFFRALEALVHALGVMVEMAFGRLSWSRPDWMPKLAQAVRRKPREVVGGEVGTPPITDYENADGTPGITIHPLQVKFSASAAPIEKVGKTVTSGITLDPDLKGKWTWVDDKTLRFVPAADWPIGAHVAVQFDVSQAFAPHVLMADDHGTFDIEPFTAIAGSGEFYQDPQNPVAKKTIMPVTFNYPVDPA